MAVILFILNMLAWPDPKPRQQRPLNGPNLAGNTPEVRNTHINIGSGEEVSIRQLAELVRQTVAFGGELIFDHTKPDGMPRKLTDVSNLHALGWRHQVLLAAGVKLFYEWYCVTGLQH